MPWFAHELIITFGFILAILGRSLADFLDSLSVRKIMLLFLVLSRWEFFTHP